MDIIRIIRNAHAYLDQFDYDHYPACFAAFSESAAGFFDALRPGELSARADALIDALEQGREALPRREKRDAAIRDKQVLALLLTPAALQRGGTAAEFAELLRQRWNERFPRNIYLAGSYEKILAGFDSNLLGLPLRKSRQRR